VLRIRAVIGIWLFIASGCASRDESLGCAELVVSCPHGGADQQQWWLARKPVSKEVVADHLEIQGGECGSWLAFIQDGATAHYDAIDLGTREGEMRLRVVVSGDDTYTHGGTLTLFADDMPTAVTMCTIKPTDGWFSWLVVDCGPLSLRGVHSLTFQFNGADRMDPWVFNFAAFGVVRSGAPDCTVNGPQLKD